MRAVGGHLSQTVLGVGRGSGSPACVSHQVPLGLHLLSLRPPLCGPGLLGRLSPGPSHLGPGHLSPASAEASPGLPSSPLPSQAALLRYSQRLEQVWDWTATASLSPTRPGDRNQDGIPPPPPPHHRARCPPARCGRQFCVFAGGRTRPPAARHVHVHQHNFSSQPAFQADCPHEEMSRRVTGHMAHAELTEAWTCSRRFGQHGQAARPPPGLVPSAVPPGAGSEPQRTDAGPGPSGAVRRAFSSLHVRSRGPERSGRSPTLKALRPQGLCF